MIDLQCVRELIIEDALSCYGDECCGVMYGHFEDGDMRIVTDIEPVDNTFPDGQRKRRFLIDAQTMFAAQKRSMQIGLDIVGFYHSHPDHEAIPSEYDTDHALPVYSYVIVSVMDGEFSDIKSYVLKDEGKYIFREEKIKKGD